MRILFMGTPDFALPTLAMLLASPHDVVGVFTQPPRPAGRGQQLQPSPVEKLARAHDRAVFTPASLRDAPTQALIANLRPDLAVVVAYGQLLPQAVLDIPRLGCVNLHASLLPRWRGAAPIQRALLAGDAATGVGLMRMEKGLDTGPLYAECRLDIAADWNGGMLHDALAKAGADLLARHLDALAAGALQPQPQPEAGLSYAHKIDKAELQINWQQPGLTIARQIRAFAPAPGAWCLWRGERLKILAAAHLDAADHPLAHDAAAPGQMIAAIKAIRAGDGSLIRPILVQRAGKQPIAADQWWAQCQTAEDYRLG